MRAAPRFVLVWFVLAAVYPVPRIEPVASQLPDNGLLKEGREEG